MTTANIIALLGAMFVLAAIPGTGVLIVVAQVLASGFKRGGWTVLGIVFGDYVYIVAAVYGLAAAAHWLGDLFDWVRYFAIGYLFFIGLSLILRKPKPMHIQAAQSSGAIHNATVGFVTTLANPKAILFYLGFLPAFLDMSTITLQDTLIVMLLATVSVGGVMLLYAIAAAAVRTQLNKPSVLRKMNIGAGALLLITGVMLVIQNA